MPLALAALWWMQALALGAPADPALMRRAVALCSGIESVGSAEQFRALGPGAEDALLAIAGDAEMLPTQRANALVALAHVPSAAGRAHLRATLADRGALPLLRRKAAFALGRGWGGEAREDLLAFAGDPDEQVRSAVGRALAAAAAGP